MASEESGESVDFEDVGGEIEEKFNSFNQGSVSKGGNVIRSYPLLWTEVGAQAS